MEHEDLDVDVSALTALIELRKQEELLDSYCRRADELKGRVDAAVFDRVTNDYSTRRRALEEQAAPLKVRASTEYRKLRLLYARVQRTHDAAKLDKEEVEFRHAIGEIDDAALAERVGEPDEILAKCASEMAALDEQEALFRDACPELPVGEEAIQELPLPESASSSDEEGMGGTPIDGEPAEAESDLTREVPNALHLVDGGSAVPVDGTAETPVPDTIDGASLESSEANEQTFIVPKAMLLSDEDEGKSINYPLGAVNYIGRSPDNQLQLSRPGVSRRHAVIMATATGAYTIRDLNSQNGTYINGERIKEGPLEDGDRISIGQVDLAFRTTVDEARPQS
ncbi:MAG: FHA domain-containing protein [Luteitalea sp.]|nr:FHA domain-containing protein [Luteitalea sp.]